MTTQTVFQIAGAIIGYQVGGPTGAAIGSAIGSGVGALVQGPEKIAGPCIGETFSVAAAPHPADADDGWARL